MGRVARTVLVWPVCILCSFFVQGQNQRVPRGSGTIIGHVFATRQDGSLMPAGTATVILVQAQSAEALTSALNDFNKTLSDAHATASSLPAEKKKQLEELAETERLQVLLRSIKPLRDEILPAVPSTTTDAIGGFTLADMPSDKYMLIAIGHAGTTAGLWLADVTIEAGKTYRVTMSAPIVACYDPEGYLSLDKPQTDLDRTIQLLTSREKELQGLFQSSGQSSSSPSSTNTPPQTATMDERTRAASAGTAHVDCKDVATKLEAYSAPRYPAPVVASLKCGEQVTVLCEEHGWTKVRIQGNVEGYISFNSLESSSQVESCVAPSAQNVPSAQNGKADSNASPKLKGDTTDSKYAAVFYVRAAGQSWEPHFCWAHLELGDHVYGTTTSGGAFDWCHPANPGEHLRGRFRGRSIELVVKYKSDGRPVVNVYEIHEERVY